MRLLDSTLWLPIIVGFALTLASLPWWIRWQRRQTLGQAIREDGPAGHHVKAGTPTAGGLCILLAWLLTVFGLPLLTNLSSLKTVSLVIDTTLLARETWLAVSVTLILGLLGFADDGLKMAKKHNKGVHGYTKLAVQSVLGLGLGAYVWHTSGVAETNVFGWVVPLGWAYPVWIALVFTAFSNAVNLTDGVDGLAATTLSLSFGTIGIVLAALGPFLGVSTELGYVALVAVGTLLAFWLFNRHPAHIFMGDTGSLALGGLLATLGILARMEWWLLGFGLLFVLEALSVTLQVGSMKLRGTRIFRMSPLHHHFELGGWSEVKIVRAFVLIQLAGCIAALLLLPRLAG